MIEALYDLTKGDAYITTGVGQHQMWAAQWYKYKFPRQLVTSGGLGSMGYGYPAALGVKVYPTALEPFKFPEAVLVNGGGKGYGEIGFKLDAAQPGYVRLDNRLFKRLFGDFAPSRGDLVLSKTGELLGIMVNSDYCALVTNFLPLKTLRTGDDVKAQHSAEMLNDLAARVRLLPLKLQ